MKKYTRGVAFGLGVGAATAFVGAPIWMNNFDVRGAPGDPPVASIPAATPTDGNTGQWNNMGDTGVVIEPGEQPHPGLSPRSDLDE